MQVAAGPAEALWEAAAPWVEDGKTLTLLGYLGNHNMSAGVHILTHRTE